MGYLISKAVLLGLASWACLSAAQAAETAGGGQAKGVKPKTAAVTAPPVAPLNAEELAIAQQVHLGRLPCELGKAVRIEVDTQQPGYFQLHGQGFRYRMRPVATSSGAITW